MIIHHDPRDGVALAAFKSEWWPASRRNSGRLQIGTPGRLRRNTHLADRWAVSGINCMRPRAPALDCALGSKALSWRVMANTIAFSTRLLTGSNAGIPNVG